MPTVSLLGAAEVLALAPTREPHPDALGDLRSRMQRSGQWQVGQMAGRRWPVACVSLEITQRCNLDCTLCYLSDSSEAVRDLPLEEVFRRIDLIVAHYGSGTDVQVSGGEPTLRRRDELVQIVERIAQRGLRASLFTNGIKASRELLTVLAKAGLTDVAFHVDMTQQRAGFTSEAALNTLRSDYIERARGLGLGLEVGGEHRHFVRVRGARRERARSADARRLLQGPGRGGALRVVPAPSRDRPRRAGRAH
jgi:7,8-dihydro-6-hydroxymethylpterin dimethyltransferase